MASRDDIIPMRRGISRVPASRPEKRDSPGRAPGVRA